MPIYQSRSDTQPDSAFRPGHLGVLKPGNVCRRLDQRRTTGVVEAVFPEEGMFRWRISEFEDRGSFWDLPLEEVVNFQFAVNALSVDSSEKSTLAAAVELFDRPLIIPCHEEDRLKSEAILDKLTEDACLWLERNSSFFSASYRSLNFHSRQGPRRLAEDLQSYMKRLGLQRLEEKTATNMVLNPSSGEWIKGMGTVLAEAGIAPYSGKIPRTSDIFLGAGAKERRQGYLFHRLAFVRAYFTLVGCKEVLVYRGFSWPAECPERPSSAFTSYTFSRKVASAHTEHPAHGERLNTMFEERIIPVNALLMTYLETAAMNRQYLEAEAVVLGE